MGEDGKIVNLNMRGKTQPSMTSQWAQNDQLRQNPIFSIIRRTYTSYSYSYTNDVTYLIRYVSTSYP